MQSKNYLDEHLGDIEIYTLLNGRSNLLLDYNQNDYEEVFDANITEIESVYVSNKYNTPATTWSHVPGPDKITVTYNTFT